ELLDGADQAERALLDEVPHREALALVAAGDRHHEAQVGVDHPLLGDEVAALDLLRQLDLLGGREQGPVARLPHQQLEGVERRLLRGDGLGVWSLRGVPFVNTYLHARYCTPRSLLRQQPFPVSSQDNRPITGHVPRRARIPPMTSAARPPEANGELPAFAHDSSLVADAWRLALDAYRGRADNGAGTSNAAADVEHPAITARLLHDAGCDETTVATAVLHDVIEDTGLDAAAIQECCGAEVARRVRALTEDDSIGAYAERKRELRARGIAAGPEVAVVMAADKIARATRAA